MKVDFKDAFRYTLAILVVGICLLSFPSDDGLRHVGVAFAPFAGWSEVYPFSLFENFRGYDPWFGYDLALRGMARILLALPLSEIQLKIILVKIILLVLLASFTFLILSRSAIMEGIRDGYSFALVNIVLVGMLGFVYARITSIRPFVFGTLFLLYSIGRTGSLRGVISSMILMLLYPYLSWLYILPTALAHFVRGSRSFASGAMGSLIVFLALQPEAFWDLELSVLRFNQKGAAINFPIGELLPSFKVLSPYLYLAALLLLLPRLPRETRKLNYVNLMIILYIVPGVRHIRYFLDILLPLAFVAFSREILVQFTEPFARLIFAWVTIFQDEYFPAIKDRLHIGKRKKDQPATPPTRTATMTPGRTSTVVRRVFLVSAYLVSLLYLVRHSVSQRASELDDLRGLLKEVPQRTRILSSFNLQYQILFVRPDLQLVPSCAISWPSEEIAEPYERYLNEGKVSPLMDKIGAQYFVENHDMEIDPREGIFLDLWEEKKKIRLWKRNQASHKDSWSEQEKNPGDGNARFLDTYLGDETP